MTRSGVIVLLVVLIIVVALVVPHALPLRTLWLLIGLLAGVVVARYL